MKFRPTPAKFIGATTASLRPNWPQRHPAKTPTHAPTGPPPTPRATTALLVRLPATSSTLTAQATTAKSPSGAAATATVVGATTVATTSDLRQLHYEYLIEIVAGENCQKLKQSNGQAAHAPWAELPHARHVWVGSRSVTQLTPFATANKQYHTLINTSNSKLFVSKKRGLLLCYCCLLKPFFLPNDISSTPSVLPDSSS